MIRVLKHRIRSIFQYEFWPFWFFYIPAYFYGLYLSLKARSFTYYSAANPGLRYGGAFGYSKVDLLDQIPHDFKPKSVLISPKDVDQILSICHKEFQYPIIIKPNIGERGKDVEKVSNDKELLAYFDSKPIQEYILQDFIPSEFELGVFYSKNPGPQITSILVKEFLIIKGEGKHTLREAILNNIRAYKRKDYLFEKYKDRLDQILETDEKIFLEPIGNHNRGTKFMDGSHLINENLVKIFDYISNSIEGFDYGRFDLKAKDIDSFQRGEHIKIFEVNGINSEPAHIYDPTMKIWDAYKAVFKHMKILFEISRRNHKNGIPFISPLKLYPDLFRHVFLS